MIALPEILVLEAAAVCNLRCRHCPCGEGLTPQRARPYMDLALAGRVLAQVGRVTECYPALWGEPTLHPCLLDLLALIRPYAHRVTLTTNGVNVDARLAAGIARLVDHVLVGVPAGTASGYHAFCGADRFEDALRGLRLLAAEAPQRTEWIFVTTSANVGEADVARAAAAELGVSFRLKSVWLRPSAPVTPAGTSRYTADGHPLVDRATCHDFWRALQVLADGQMTTCCYDFVNEVVVGDANTQHVIDDVWRGDTYERLRAEHAAGRWAGFCCTNCGMVP